MCARQCRSRFFVVLYAPSTLHFVFNQAADSTNAERELRRYRISFGFLPEPVAGLLRLQNRLVATGCLILPNGESVRGFPAD